MKPKKHLGLDVDNLVIIHEDLVNKLKLCHKRLCLPIFTQTSMHDGQQNVIEFDEFVKLQLYDVSGQYILKSVHLCTNIVRTSISETQ